MQMITEHNWLHLYYIFMFYYNVYSEHDIHTTLFCFFTTDNDLIDMKLLLPQMHFLFIV